MIAVQDALVNTTVCDSLDETACADDRNVHNAVSRDDDACQWSANVLEIISSGQGEVKSFDCSGSN